MTEEIKQLLESFKTDLKSVVDTAFEKELPGIVGPMVSQEVKGIVQQLRLEQAIYGQDKSGLDEEQKINFAKLVKTIVSGTKANEALVPEVDSRGGYLIPKEVAKAILRIAASVGIVLSQATQWPMGSDELGIPNYTGSFLEGEYLGVDAAGDVTGLSLGEAKLIIKTWQLAFVVNKGLLADATVNLADWLLALASEALANMIDKQAFIGTGNPFVGLLYDPNVPTFTLGSSKDAFTDFNVIEDGSDVIASLEDSVDDGAAFYMHKTVWAKLRAQKDGTTGNYILPMAGAVSNAVLANYPAGGGKKPIGELLGKPVFGMRHLPDISTVTQANVPFMVYGNFKAFAYGSRGEMTIEQFTSGSFGGKEIALANQRGLVMNDRHALVNALPDAFVVVYTHS